MKSKAGKSRSKQSKGRADQSALDLNRERSPFLNRLAELLERSGMSGRMLCKEADLSVSYVHDLFTGRTSKPSYEATQAIAKVLGVTVAFLMGQDNHDRAIEDMPVVGMVETGAFRSIMETNEMMVMRPTNKVHPQAKHFVYMVNDTAMVADPSGPFHPGMELLCNDLNSADVEVENGRLYVIKRTLDGGRTYETILRRVKVSRHQTELLASSGNKDRDAQIKIVIPGRLVADERMHVFAIGLVYGTFHEIK